MCHPGTVLVKKDREGMPGKNYPLNFRIWSFVSNVLQPIRFNDVNIRCISIQDYSEIKENYWIRMIGNKQPNLRNRDCESSPESLIAMYGQKRAV